ncbi:MAG: hypothetical protein ACK4UP_12250 [Spirosomataceae bacterium]
MKQNTGIMYIDPSNPQELKYGLVESADGRSIKLSPLQFSKFGDHHNCPTFDSHVKGAPIAIPISHYRGHFSVTDGFVNKYVVLNIIKK